MTSTRFDLQEPLTGADLLGGTRASPLSGKVQARRSWPLAGRSVSETQGRSHASPGWGIRYPTPRSLRMYVGAAASSPSLRRRLLTKARIGLDSA